MWIQQRNKGIYQIFVSCARILSKPPPPFSSFQFNPRPGFFCHVSHSLTAGHFVVCSFTPHLPHKTSPKLSSPASNRPSMKPECGSWSMKWNTALKMEARGGEGRRGETKSSALNINTCLSASTTEPHARVMKP